MKSILSTKKVLLTLLLSFVAGVQTASAVTVSDGSVNYSLSMQALAEMTTSVVATMGYVVGLLYAVASLLAIYNAMVIYIKINTGEGGLTKAIVMLVGSAMFLIGATVVLPAFFGYNAMSGWERF